MLGCFESVNGVNDIGLDGDWFDKDKMEAEDMRLENDEGTDVPSLIENAVQQCVLNLLISLSIHLPLGIGLICHSV